MIGSRWWAACDQCLKMYEDNLRPESRADLTSKLEAADWYVDGDVTICPNCKEEAR